MLDHEGWNLVELDLPCFGMLHLAFKGDTIRIRKADSIFLRPIEFTFTRGNAEKTVNAKAYIKEEIDY